MKIKWKYKLYSGALQFTIFVSVVIALLLAGIVLLTYTHRYFIHQSKAIAENIHLSDSGISTLLLENELSSDTLDLIIPDSDNGQIINIHLSQWGIFEKGFAKTRYREKKYTKGALLGSGIPSSERNALYLRETYKPLVVVGNTKITGTVLLPEQGIKTGNINGNSYYGSQLIYGSIQRSKPELPMLKYDYRKQLNYYLKEFKPLRSNDYIKLNPGEKVINPFKEPVRGYYSENEIVLNNVSLTGNIIIRSEKKITVKSNTLLSDIIIVAPEIIIDGQVEGSFQAIADTSIKIGANSKLNYPTALVLVEKDNPEAIPYNHFSNKIYINQGTIVKGSICFFSRQDNLENFLVNIFIDERALVKGEVYCDGNLELKGAVTGTVYTNQFIANEGGTVFVNHVYNGTINGSELPHAFGGVLFDENVKCVVKWLY